MPRILLLAYFAIIFTGVLSGQVYHYETGKVIPVDKPDQLFWRDGTYQNYPARFGTLVVNENRGKRSSQLINIPVIRIPGIKPDSNKGPVFLLNGGPGESNLNTPLFFSELLIEHDIVIVGYRGVDGSVKLDCPCMANALMSDTITLENSVYMFRLAIDSCKNIWAEKNIDFKGYSMDEVVDDIEVVRGLLGYAKISLLAFSYGTMLSQLYGKKYPRRVSKMVLVGARPLNDFLFDAGWSESGIIKSNNNYSTSKHTKKSGGSSFLYEMDSLIDNSSLSLNGYRFMLFGFSKLYSFEGAQNLFNAFADTKLDSAGSLMGLYNDFFKNYPGGAILGDIVLKKQGRVNFDGVTPEPGLAFRITSAVNNFYTPNCDIMHQKAFKLSKKHFNGSVEALLIAGEFDIASPARSIIDTDYLGIINHEMVLIPGAGHLDLLTVYKKSIQKMTTLFLGQ